MKINSISSFATPDESPIKNNNKKSSINQVIDKAADVFISEKGKELLMQDKGKDLEIGPATNELKSMEEKQAKIYESKGKIKEIEKRLEEDETLTDDDKNVLLEEKADAAVINAKKEQNKEDKIVMDNSELIQQENSITSDTVSYLKTNYPQKEKNDNSIGRVKES